MLLALLVVAAGLHLWREASAARSAGTARAVGDLDLAASLAAYEAHRIIGPDGPAARHVETLTETLPGHALGLVEGRHLYLSDAHGFIVGSTALERRPPRTLSDLLGGERSHAADETGRVIETSLPDGTAVIAAIRDIGRGHLALVQRRDTLAGGAFGFGTGQHAAAMLLLLGIVGFTATCHRHQRRAWLSNLACTRLARRLDASLARGRCGVWDYDLETGCFGWSRSMYELLGYEPRQEPLSAAEVAAILHPEDGSIRLLLEGMAASSSHLDHEIRARTATGGWVWLRITGQSAIDPADGSRHVLGSAIDVTGERGAAERRASDDLRLRDAVEAISEVFVLWDADDRLILCNSKFLKLHEIPPESALPGTARPRVLASARAPIAESEISSGPVLDPGTRTFERQFADGRWLHVNERRTKDGGTVSVGRDVSELKRKEARLRARERHLQGTVRAAETERQRYAEIAERHYEANLAKTEFLARMSHELRTPLNAIIGFSDCMLSGVLGPLGPERYAEYTRDIHASGQQLLGIIDDILQMSRIEQGQLDLCPELMQIGPALDVVLEAVRADADQKGVSVEVDIVPPAILYADESAVREMLVQLVHNAVRFSRQNGRVRVRVRPAGQHLNVFVEDEGCGIPDAILPCLGRPFTQVEAEYSRAGGGAGLGLAITRALAELHGGRLRLRSQQGAGTVAMIHLPLVPIPANDPASADAPPHPPLLRLVAAE